MKWFLKFVDVFVIFKTQFVVCIGSKNLNCSLKNDWNTYAGQDLDLLFPIVSVVCLKVLGHHTTKAA